MVPSGAKNPKGAALFIDTMRDCYANPEFRPVLDQSIINDKGYTQEQYEFLSSFEDMSKYDVVVEGYTGFNADLTKLIDNMLINVAFEVGEGEQQGYSWTRLCEENEGPINNHLKDFLP